MAAERDNDPRAAQTALFCSRFDDFVRPIEDFLADDGRDELLVPSHLEAIQEGFDLMGPFAALVPDGIYHAGTRALRALRDRLEQLLFSDLTAPGADWAQGEDGTWGLFIDDDIIMELSSLRFTDKRMAELLGCSVMTIRRRRESLGLSKRYAIEDVRQMGTGEAGERCLKGALASEGIFASRAQIREAVHTLDPIRLGPRWRTPLHRRQYYVPFVSSLWHMDGHHKLIRWRFVINGCIDGKSRTCVFMRAHSDNTAASVTACFDDAIAKWGCPSRVRADFGGENLGVKAEMEQRRGLGRGSFIQGSSTHNQRIERLWVDLQRLTTDKYKAIFQHLEGEGLLDVTNAIHMWALHFIFIPQLNNALRHFVDMWNLHPMRTRGLGNKSPLQLRAEGILEAKSRGIQILDGFDDDQYLGEHAPELDAGLRSFALYGYEATTQGRERNENDQHVHLEAIDHLLPAIVLDHGMQAEWRRRLPPSWPPPADHGIVAYCQLLHLISEQLTD